MNNLKVVQRSYLLLNSVKNQYGLSQLNQLSFTANTIIQKGILHFNHQLIR